MNNTTNTSNTTPSLRSPKQSKAVTYSPLLHRPKMKTFKKLLLNSHRKNVVASFLDSKIVNSEADNMPLVKSKPSFVLDCCSVLADKIPKYKGGCTPNSLDSYSKVDERIRNKLKSIITFKGNNPKYQNGSAHAILLVLLLG